MAVKCVTGVVDNYVTDVIYSNFYRRNHMANKYTENALSHLTIPTCAGVYILTETVSGRTYIGSSKNMRDRIGQHFSKLKNNYKDCSLYARFKDAYDTHDIRIFSAVPLIICSEENLLMYERVCIDVFCPTENTLMRSDGRLCFSPEERILRGARVKELWATEEYRNNAIAARKGKAYNKGYKCTPAQVENRRKAARISNIKRKFSLDWKEQYILKYPEFAGDVDGR